MNSWFIYKKTSQRFSQAAATALKNIAASSQQTNKSVRDLVNADLIELNTELNNVQLFMQRSLKSMGDLCFKGTYTTEASTSTRIENASFYLKKIN